MIQAVVVPKDLYYVEYRYVRRLEALAKKADEYITNLLEHEGAEGFSASTEKLMKEYVELLAEHRVKTLETYGKDIHP